MTIYRTLFINRFILIAINKKARRGSTKNHIKGPKKRTNEDDERFAQSFEKLVLMAQAKEY